MAFIQENKGNQDSECCLCMSSPGFILISQFTVQIIRVLSVNLALQNFPLDCPKCVPERPAGHNVTAAKVGSNPPCLKIRIKV